MGVLDFLQPREEEGEVTEVISDAPHEWELISKTYAPPRKTLEDIPAALIEKSLFGVTTFLWQCKLTGETKKEQLIGSDENQFDEICANASAFGPQYIEREGGMYIVARWETPQQQATTQPNIIPVR